ncbi:polysaccharide deacetylase family protein [Bosea sp. PAMC 26642]|uniref:polysaccharide deacetylase family protein n=1 Tax=Bosea sp. (strain PAMC 26642) TaxID=1792307 RepID=UPI0007705177|nr:polysaccharide deacetylase [Bosea sp. PAMC 26642]AMJ59738.1 polysaccharide deacetylase [Bosea sp. PAMC 26642]
MNAALTIDSDPWTWPEPTWRGIVSHVRAGRSLKPSRWKGGAAFAVALSFDSDHETIELRNGGKSYSRISQGQYGARAGMPRILSRLAAHGVPATFFMPAVAALLNEAEIKAVAQAGHEIGIHSWIHESNSRLDEATERDLTLRARDVLESLSGQRPVGMRTASWDFSPWTLKIVREMGLLYDSSLMADDEPYELLDGGKSTGIVEVPVEWIRDDAVYFNMDRAMSLRPYGGPEMVLDIFRRELDLACEEGGLFQLTMHPHHSGHRSRIWILDEIICAAKAKGSVWFATHAEIAAWCAAEAELSIPRDDSATA